LPENRVLYSCKVEKYFSMIQEKSTVEIELTKLKESLKEEKARFE
jgi:hypothetical protein